MDDLISFYELVKDELNAKISFAQAAVQLAPEGVTVEDKFYVLGVAEGIELSLEAMRRLYSEMMRENVQRQGGPDSEA